MSRPLDYEIDPELSELVDRLRAELERRPPPDAAAVEEVDAVMRLLMQRNQRRRVLMRMQIHGWMDGRPEQARADLEALDAQLRERLVPLVARLVGADSPQGA